MHLQGFADRVGDGAPRIERGTHILVHQRDMLAQLTARQSGQRDTSQLDASRGGGNEP